MAVDIDGLLAPGGALSEVGAAFEDRPQQRRMAQAVADALETNGNLVVEAGTGVGKSLGYLLPGALWAVTHGRRLLVSTHTRALQEQILSRELPTAAAALRRFGHTLRYAMLQGADNYLCVQRLARARLQTQVFSEAGNSLLQRLDGWARTAESGHRASLPALVPQTVWSKIARDPEVCLGPQGPYWGSCLYRKDKERAERSHVLVINHALLLSGTRLPPYDALVVDEAHSLEDAAVSHFGFAVTEARLIRVLEDARGLAAAFPELGELAARCAQESRAFFDAAAAVYGLAEGSSEFPSKLLSSAEPPKEPATWLELEALCVKLISAQSESNLEMELRLLHARVSGLRADLAALLVVKDDGVARWIEKSQAGVSLKAAPLDVSDRLGEGIFSRGVPTIMTSATLSGPGGLRQFRSQVGLEPAKELVVDSPFDYESQAALLLVDGMPAPGEDRRYAAALARECKKVVDCVPGGVFLLFSSWKTLRSVHARLRKRIKDRPIWVQGDAGHDALLAEFTAAGNAVLLGVDTFWQGVDVPGEALSCVVLTKLPFPNPGSPVEEARRQWYSDEGRDYFGDHSLPRAVMKFRQGFGRLIRSTTDRGAVVVLDSRVVSRGYGKAFLEALPRCKKLESLEDLKAFFG